MKNESMAERKILHAIRRKKTNWVVYSLFRNCRLKHVIEGKLEERNDVTRRKKT